MGGWRGDKERRRGMLKRRRGEMGEERGDAGSGEGDEERRRWEQMRWERGAASIAHTHPRRELRELGHADRQRLLEAPEVGLEAVPRVQHLYGRVHSTGTAARGRSPPRRLLSTPLSLSLRPRLAAGWVGTKRTRRAGGHCVGSGARQRPGPPSHRPSRPDRRASPCSGTAMFTAPCSHHRVQRVDGSGDTRKGGEKAAEKCSLTAPRDGERGEEKEGGWKEVVEAAVEEEAEEEIRRGPAAGAEALAEETVETWQCSLTAPQAPPPPTAAAPHP